MLNLFLGFALFIHYALFIVPLTGILGVSPEKHYWRDRLLCNDLLEEYGNFYNSTSIFFHGYFSLHLPFPWGFSIKKVQSDSNGEWTFFFHLHDYECKQFFDFQVLARFMVGLNLLLPIFSFSFILIDKSPSLNICLGKGYLNFFSTKAQFCPEDNPYKNCLCWVWLTILSIGKSKFQINSLARISNLINSIT